MNETQPAQNEATRADRRTLTPEAGSHINAVCEQACAMAAQDNDLVTFTFNDVLLVASPTTDWRELSKEYSRKCDEAREAYLKSPEGIAATEKRNQEVSYRQETVSRLIYKLPIVLAKSLDAVIEWLKEFTSPADDIGVKFNASDVARTFIAYGYKENYGVGEKPEWFNTRDRMGRYIIGQAINCLKSGMAPHGVTYTFIEKYKALPVSESKSKPIATSAEAESLTRVKG